MEASKRRATVVREKRRLLERSPERSMASAGTNQSRMLLEPLPGERDRGMADARCGAFVRERAQLQRAERRSSIWHHLFAWCISILSGEQLGREANVSQEASHQPAIRAEPSAQELPGWTLLSKRSPDWKRPVRTRRQSVTGRREPQRLRYMHGRNEVPP